MDNDDYRRGRLTNHKVYGEAMAVLAGDGLLNFAFEYCLDENSFDLESVKALKLLGEYAGATGMIAGQVLDLQNEKNNSPNEQILYDIYRNKTAKLLTAPLLIASIFAKNKHFDELKDFGYNLGVMFQITDDIMDVEGELSLIGKTPHKDSKVDKLTSIKVFGLDGAKKKAEHHYNASKKILSKLDNCEFLSAFNDAMYNRKS
jgi:geranylgeranyl diphosphate synthase type II